MKEQSLNQPQNEENEMIQSNEERAPERQNNREPDKRNQQIKNEPDTARLRSERQSVIDGEKKQ